MITLSKSKRIVWIVLTLGAIMILVLIYSVISTRPTKSREEFISLIPYYTADYTIVYSPEKDQIYINILQEPYEENRMRAEDWIKANGQNPKNLEVKYTPTNIFNNLNKN